MLTLSAPLWRACIASPWALCPCTQVSSTITTWPDREPLIAKSLGLVSCALSCRGDSTNLADNSAGSERPATGLKSSFAILGKG